jgi:hypothetical protein
MAASLTWAAAVAGGAGVWHLLSLAHAARRARQLSGRTVPYQRWNGPDGPAMLVAGDSRSVGVGACAPEHSVAGRIAAACPAPTVANRARAGARLADVPARPQIAPRRRSYAVLLAIGGNDALGLTPGAALGRDAHGMMVLARRLVPCVVVATAANLGSIPVLPWALVGLMRIHPSSACHDPCFRAIDRRAGVVDALRAAGG